MGSGIVINKAIRKYGKENFYKEILCICEDEASQNEMEIYWIEELGSFGPNGYNLTRGGEGCLGLVFSEESKQRSSESKKKYFVDNPEARERISKMAKLRVGPLNSFWGKKLTPEHIAKMTATRIAAITGGSNPSAIRMLCIEEDLIFDTATDAALWCGLKHPTTILKAAKGQRNKAGGYTWMILPKEENIPQEMLTQDTESLTMDLHKDEHTRNQHHDRIIEDFPNHLQE